MAHFDRFDICEAYLAFEQDYHSGGWLHERPSNRRRKESTDVQLSRMKFRPGANFNGFASLSENGKDIYCDLENRYHLHSGNVASFQVIDHGEDGSSYFPGCGTAFTDYAHVATGVGDTAKEALEDALESMAQNDHLPSEAQIHMMGYELADPDKSAHASLDAHDCERDGCDWNHYVSIRYNVRGEVA